MKLLTKTGLILIFMIEPVLACDISPEFSKIHESRLFYHEIFFYSSLALLIPIIILYFLRKRTESGLWIVITAVISVFLTLFLGFIALLFFGTCTDVVFKIVRVELIIMLSLFLFQLFSWISQRKN